MKTIEARCKYIFYLAILILTAGIIPGCFLIPELPDSEGHIPIIEQTTYFEEDTSANPVPFKVAVYKTDFMGPAYRVVYNYAYKDSLMLGGVIYGSEAEYDMAYFKWTNDSTVTIRLYHSMTDQFEEFYVFGMPSNSGSGMGGRDDDKDE
jgi:hypothetical protein